MIFRSWRLIAMTGIALLAFGGDRLSFEAASVKPSSPSVDYMNVGALVRGGPGTDDPLRFRILAQSVCSLIRLAYDFKHSYQMVCPPALNELRIDVDAVVPKGATRDQSREMLRNLINDRFQIVSHREKREITAYDLIVLKGGSKLKSAKAAPPDAANHEGKPDVHWDSAGFPVFEPWSKRTMASGMDLRQALNLPGRSIDELVEMIEHFNFVPAPIGNQTGLDGKFDISLRFTRSPRPTDDPDIFAALEEQLGLKLRPRKAEVDVLVIDRGQKTPTPN
jgi:uncharacterized protein (TIGR03435 family)